MLNGFFRAMVAVAGVFALVIGLAGGAQAQQMLGGGYYGIDAADGMRIRISPNGAGYSGELTDRAGMRYAISARALGPSAEARIETAQGPALIRLTPKPLGLSMVWVPTTPDGQLRVEGTAVHVFLHDSVPLPEAPKFGAAKPPSYDGERVDETLFLTSYEFWTPVEVGRGYTGIREKFRTLIRLFPHVQTDILWKLCKSPVAVPGVAEALRGQGVTCNDVVAAVDQSRANGRFLQFKADVQRQKEDLGHAVACGRNMKTPAECREIAKTTQAAALSMETVATVLARLR